MKTNDRSKSPNSLTVPLRPFNDVQASTVHTGKPTGSDLSLKPADKLHVDTQEIQLTPPLSGRSSPSPVLAVPHASVPNRPLINAPPEYHARLHLARGGFVSTLQGGPMTTDQIARKVVDAYPEATWLVGDGVKASPESVSVHPDEDFNDLSARLRDNPEFAKVISRLRFLNSVLSGNTVQANGGQPLSPEATTRMQNIAERFRDPDASSLWNIEAFVTGVVVSALGKSDELMRPLMNAAGVSTQSAERRLNILIEHGGDRVPALRDVSPAVLEALRLFGRAEANLGQFTQGELPAAALEPFKTMSADQRAWLGLQGLVQAAAAAGVTEKGAFPMFEGDNHIRQLRALQSFAATDPVSGHFSLVQERAVGLNVPLNADGYAFTRLVMHMRDISVDDIAAFKTLWLSDAFAPTREKLARGLSQTGLSESALRSAAPGWELSSFGTGQPAPMLQFGPAFLNNLGFRLADDERSPTLQMAAFERGLVSMGELCSQAETFIKDRGLPGGGVLRIDMSQLAAKAWKDPSMEAAKFFDFTREAGNGADAIRYEAVAYGEAGNLDRIARFVGNGPDECRLQQLLGKLLMADRNLVPSGFVQKAQRAASPAETGPLPRTAPATDADFTMTADIEKALMPVFDKFTARAQAMLAPDLNHPTPATPELRAIVAEFKQAIKDAGVPSEKPFRNFIGLLDKLAANAGTRGAADHYALRRLCMFSSEGEVESWMAFTYAKRVNELGFWKFIEDPRAWLPERVAAVQQFAAGRILVSAVKTSEAIANVEQPERDLTMKVAGGGYSSGKTTNMKVLHKKALEGSDVQVFGLVGSDFLKANIRNQVDCLATPSMLHVECSQLAFSLSRDISDSMRGIYLIDSSMASTYDLQRYLDMNPDAAVRVAAVHVPLHVTMMRMLMRSVSGDDPRISFKETVEGWRRTVDSRKDICNIVTKNKDRVTYDLMMSDRYGGDYRPVVNIEGGVTKTLDQGRWDDSLDRLPEQNVESMRTSTARAFLADRNNVSEADAARFTQKLSQRLVRRDALTSDEQQLVEASAPDLKGKAQFTLLDLPLGVALDVHQRQDSSWPDEIAAAAMAA